MRKIDFDSRTLYFVDQDETVGEVFKDRKYAVLFLATPESLISAEWKFLESLLSSNCAEVYFVGSIAEEAHDLFDEIVENRGYFEALTTWDSGKPVEDICYYFLNVAGAKPSVLFAIVGGDQMVERALRDGAHST